MTTGYIIEVKIGHQIRYVGAAGKIGQFPKFFNNSARVKTRLASNRFGNSCYHAATHFSLTTVIQVKNLEAGMAGSQATKFTAQKFMEQDHSGKFKANNNPNAIYMIQFSPDLQLAKSADPIYVKKKDKFAHRWQSAGALRGHIAANLGNLTGKYRGAKVIEVEMGPDGFTPKQVKTFPIADFYCASPISRKSFESHFKTKYYISEPA